MLSISFLFLLNLMAIAIGSNIEVLQQRVVVNASELCIFPITPSLFKWDRKPGYINQIRYIPKISNSPDLPDWLHFTYDGHNSIAYIYGVPPLHLTSMSLDVYGWNKAESYAVHKLIISMEIIPREDLLPFVTELKIDNLDIKEMASPRRIGELSKILTEQFLWGRADGSKRLIPVFMASAVELGENRVPVKPMDAEGVVIHFASDQEFSQDLKKLQAEVAPLWRLPRPCQRDLKRTSVERHFRRYNFLVDWCSFRLTHLEAPYRKDKEGGRTHGESVDADAEVMHESIAVKEGFFPSEPEIFFFRSDIPKRTYRFEILLSTLIPGSIGALVGFLLIVLLHSDRDENAEIDEDALFFEAAFRLLHSVLRFKKPPPNGNQYIYHHAPQPDAGIVVMTRDIAPGVIPADEIEIRNTPIPPQYTQTHPNGAPALIYAV